MTNFNEIIEEIINELKKHNVSHEKLEEVRKAYNLASEIHKEQYRQSGEPYIIHPLAVAKILIFEMDIYDPDTIISAILHDVIEDSKGKIKKDDLEAIFNSDCAILVDGVSKISRMDFLTKKDQNLANFRKIINGLTKDIRIILIKLADRLHNMRTLDVKKPEKQLDNSEETMHLFVPLALTIGAYKIKSELEDLALKYIDHDSYLKIKEQKSIIAETKESYLQEMRDKISAILNTKNINHEILLRTKNICTTYRILNRGYKIENIYDLCYLKILVDEVNECYETLGIVHQQYPPLNGRFKDYIYNPRTNLYQSLHTTVTTTKSDLTKVKIRTFDMDKVSANGISALWNIKNPKTKEETQKIVRTKFQFAKKLIELDESIKDNEAFVDLIKSELLTEHVYVYNNDGEIFELPYGSTCIDYICHIYPELLDRMAGILINGKEVPFNYILKNNDRVSIKTDGKINKAILYENAFTTSAKKKLKQFNGQN